MGDEERLNLVSQIIDSFKDETQTVNKYVNLANNLRRIGMDEEAQILDGIANDENRHASFFAAVSKKLTSCNCKCP